MALAIHWFRRDLRLSDNTALNAAVAAFDEVLPVYIVSEWKEDHHWTGPMRQQFLCGSLASLNVALERAGSNLVIRQGRDQCAVLEELAIETGARAIYFNRDPDPYGKAMEERIVEMGARLGIEVHGLKDHTLCWPDQVLTGEGRPYKVFGAYARAWQKVEKVAPGSGVRSLRSPKDVRSLPLPDLSTWNLATKSAHIVEAGETAALKRLASFLDRRVHAYGELRNLPGSDGSSRISQDLRWGLLSVREVFAECQKSRESATADGKRHADIFINELIWREFAFQVLWNFPNVLDREFLPQFRELKWKQSGAGLEAWKQGRTGFPIVDAGIRQLLHTGFMHNRVRMIVAMFLCKDLHASWKVGESFFMQHLVDGEIASNNLGWQWCASVGTDAQPYFRIQNPWTQTARHDPDGDYIRRWVPELSKVPAKRLSTPPKAGERLAIGYPPPILDHSTERDAALSIYREAAARYKAQHAAAV